jgi:poly(hydroxyalkanoate) granule-associated protein
MGGLPCSLFIIFLCLYLENFMVTKLTKTAPAKKTAPSKKAAPGKKTATRKTGNPLSNSVKDSAQQIWQAGLGAFTKAQTEGTKAFEALVKEGISFQRKTQSAAEDKINEATQKMTSMATDISSKASGQWDKLESIFEDRVAKVLNKMGVPSAKDITVLIARIDALNTSVQKLSPTKAKTPAKTTAKPVEAGKPAAKVAAKPADKPAPKATAKKTSTRKAVAVAKAKEAPAAQVNPEAKIERPLVN